MKHVKVLSKKNIAGNDVLTLSEVKLQLPSGKTKSHLNVERIPAVTVFPITENQEIYLISQYRYILDKEIIEAVAGRVDEGEDPLFSAKRELREEAGIIATDWKELTKVDLAGSFIKAKVFLFLARGLKLEKQELKEDENITLMKVSLDEAIKKAMNGEITTSTSIVGILWLDRLRREGKL